MTRFNKIMLAALTGAGVLAFSGISASAAVVCSGGECWHTHESYDYPRDSGVIVHPDNWRWGPHEHFTWREHEGRGYWHGGQWRDF